MNRGYIIYWTPHVLIFYNMFIMYGKYIYCMAKDESLTRDEFEDFMKKFAGQLNEAFAHTYRRFDDLDQRLSKLEQRVDEMGSDMHTVKNDTRLIEPMFELVRLDGAEVGDLKLRVTSLEKSD